MNKSETIELTKKAEESPLWLLEMRVSRQNYLLTNLKGTGVNYKDSKWRSLVHKRNTYRKVLIKKLLQWEKGELPESNPKYSDYVDYIKDKQNNQEVKQ